MQRRRLQRQHSQVSAPIELFVAIIILAMALALGLKVVGDVEEGKCIATLKTQTQQLKNAMLDVALGGSGTTRKIFFDFPSCGRTRIEGLQFVLYTKPEYCRLCQGSYGYCWQVVPLARDSDTSGRFMQVPDAISCVNMAGDIQIQDCPGAGNAGIELLSKTPCFDDPRTSENEAENCDSRKFGITPAVWSSSQITGGEDRNPSRWKTLGGVGAKSFEIELTKKTALAGIGGGGTGRETGAIQVCAKRLNN